MKMLAVMRSSWGNGILLKLVGEIVVLLYVFAIKLKSDICLCVFLLVTWYMYEGLSLFVKNATINRS